MFATKYLNIFLHFFFSFFFFVNSFHSEFWMHEFCNKDKLVNSHCSCFCLWPYTPFRSIDVVEEIPIRNTENDVFNVQWQIILFRGGKWMNTVLFFLFVSIVNSFERKCRGKTAGIINWVFIFNVCAIFHLFRFGILAIYILFECKRLAQPKMSTFLYYY